MDRGADRLGRVGGDRRHVGAERMREGDVRDEAAAEEGADAPLRPIEELVGHENVERPVLLLQAADRARRQNPLDAEHLEAVDVRAKVQLRRQDPVAGAVARQKRDALAAQRADHVRPGRIAERRRDASLLAVGQLRHVVQAAAADDADRWIVHRVVVGLNSQRWPCAASSMIAGGDDRIVLEEYERARFSTASRTNWLLRGERVHRIQVEPHDPRIGHVRRRRHQIGDEGRRLAARFDPDHLVMHRVAACPPHLDARHDRLVVVHQLQDAGLGQRHVIVRQVAGPIALVRMRRVLPFAAPDDVLRARKARAHAAAGVAHREAARVVEMQVRGEHDVDVLGRQPGFGERVIEVPCALDAVDVAELRRSPCRRARVDDHRPHAAHDQRAHRQRDAVALVGGRFLRPERLRARRRTSRRRRGGRTRRDRDELEVAERVARDSSQRSLDRLRVSDVAAERSS